MLPQLMKAAGEGRPTRLTRKNDGREYQALLVSPQAAEEAGCDLAAAPAWPTAQARKKLGELVQHAAEGRPQVLRRHSTPVAVLISHAAPHRPAGPAPADQNRPADAPEPAQTPATRPPGHAAPAFVPGTTEPAAPAAEPTADPTAAAPRPAPRHLAPLADALANLPTPADAGQAPDAPARLPGLPTGLTTLDQALGGLQAGRFYLVAGAPGAGASLLATQAARTTALTGHLPVLYAASGLTRADVAARLIAAHTPVDYRRLRAAALTPHERQAVAETTGLLTGAPLLIDDGADLDTTAITSTVPDIDRLALLVIDRLQAAHDPRLPLSGPQAITDAVQALAHLAHTHHLPVLAALDTDDPHLLTALSADLTLTLTRDDTHARLTITERDLGPLATIALTADLTHARFTDADAPREATRQPTQPHLGTIAPTGTPTAPPPPAAPHPSASAPTAARPDPKPAPTRRRPAQPQGRIPELIHRAVHEALAAHNGDLQTATAELQRRAIPDVMALLDTCRIGARYDIVGHPPLPDILRRKTAHGADDVWEARPNWTRPDAPSDSHEVTALDINGAYLSALKTHLPLGALEYSTGNVHSHRRSGIHLITPPEWEHHSYLPNPLGSRDEPGPVWVTEPTLRLLQRLATENYGHLCDPPVIHESWTSGSTEQLFEKFRQILRDAREEAITENDEVTLEYVKSMYSKFVSTMGESNFNREIYRPDWMHIIRSQAFVNLWLKAHKAHTAGLTVIRVMGTDELHVAGDWRHIFTEGRGVSQVKVKGVYPLPASKP